MTLTASDFFCGAGGFTTGAIQVPGVEARLAVNHWRLAVDTHQHNHPTTDHDCADLCVANPRRYAATDILLASPSCTAHSYAGAGQRKKATLSPATLFADAGIDEAEQSRCSMWDVVRFAEVHRYRYIVVENVIAATKWEPFSAWLSALEALGYAATLLSLNSMMFGVPQSRDRLFCVFRRRDQPAPDLRFAVAAWCGHCQCAVDAVQRYKRQPPFGVGVYGQQYEYACPACDAVAWPQITPASAAIDWALPAERIGDRARPLSDKTLARIRRGLDRLGSQPMVVQVGGNLYERPGYARVRGAASEPHFTITTTLERGPAIPDEAMIVPLSRLHDPDSKACRPVERPLATQTARQEQALAILANRTHGVPRSIESPMQTVCTGSGHYLVDARAEQALLYAGRDHGVPRPAAHPMQSVTTINSLYLLDGGGAVIPPRGQNRARAAAEPLPAVCASGNHHGLVCANYEPGWVRDAARPLGTVTAIDHHSAMLVPYQRTSIARPVERPMPTVSCVDPAGLAEHASDVDLRDVRFRMLAPDELKRAMSFPDEYVLLGSKRQRVRLAGNAVTPPVARAIVERIAAAAA